MTDDTIFDTTVEQSTEDTPETSYYDRMVGDGKKFKDNEALAYSNFEKDRFIEQLKREQKELRDDLNSRLNMEELVNKLGKTASTPAPTGVGLESPSTPTPPVTPTSNGLSIDDVKAAVRNTMTEEQTKLMQEKNLNAVANQLKKAWGDDWVSKLRKQGAMLDLTEAQMDIMAKTSPKALLQAVLPQTTNKVDNVAPVRSSIMSIPQQPSDSGWNKYEKMRKENPRMYYSPSVQLQLERDVRAGKVILPSD